MKRFNTWLKGLLLVGAASMAASLPAPAGVVFFTGRLDEAGMLADDGAAAVPAYAVTYGSGEVSVRDGKATIALTETVHLREEQATTCFALIPVPRGVSADAVTFGRRNGDDITPVAIQLLGSDAAQALLAAIARQAQMPEILSWTQQALALVPEVTLAGKQEFVLAIEQTLSAAQDLRTLRCPLPDDRFAVEPVRRVSVSVNITDARPLRGMFSPTHECDIEREGLNQATIRMTTEQSTCGQPFELCYVAADDILGLRLLAHHAEDEDEGFFLLVGNPTGNSDPKDAVPKDILFVLDISGSMRGEKMEQARSAITYCLDQLNPRDRFNVIPFATDVSQFRESLVERTPGTIEAAKVYVDELVPAGRTNIGEALLRGLAGTSGKGRPRVMIFLTDGAPTSGERAPDKILASLKKINESDTQVFVLGVGHDVNAHLLDRIAESTDGSSEYVEPQEEIDVKVAALYNRLSDPFLNDVAIDFGDLKVASVFPRKLPALFRGSEIMVAGRYRGGGDHTVRLRGKLYGEDREYVCKASLPEKAADAYAFVAPLWATRKIGFYLQEIRLHGENDELIDEVVKLSRRYGIITEYTAFLAEASSVAMTDADAANEARQRMRRANRVQSGQWAFNQARNDKSLQQRVAINAAANMYVDRQGEVRNADNIRQLGKNAYYMQDGRWVEANASERKVRKVKQFSEEYFELVKANAKFAEAQSLGGLMTVNIGDEAVAVY